jgi:hypothetical protein
MALEKPVTRTYQSCTNSYRILIRKSEVKVALGRIGEDMRVTLERVLKEQNMFLGLNLTKDAVYYQAAIDKIMNIPTL